MEITKCPCGNASMTYEVIGEDLWSAVAVNTDIEQDGWGKRCLCKSCGRKYDNFDPCMIELITHKDQTTLEQLSQEEFSPAQLLSESNDTIIKLLNEPKQYRVIGEVYPIDVDTDFDERYYSDINPGL